jgi:hypothetical protein
MARGRAHGIRPPARAVSRHAIFLPQQHICQAWRPQQAALNDCRTAGLPNPRADDDDISLLEQHTCLGIHESRPQSCEACQTRRTIHARAAPTGLTKATPTPAHDPQWRTSSCSCLLCTYQSTACSAASDSLLACGVAARSLIQLRACNLFIPPAARFGIDTHCRLTLMSPNSSSFPVSF